MYKQLAPVVPVLRSRLSYALCQRQTHASPKPQPKPAEPQNTFEFTPENRAEIQKILAKYPANFKRAATIPLLHLAQKQAGWLPLSAMKAVASILDVNPINVYESATFYTMFNKEPVGKNFVQVCTTLSCMLRGSGDVLRACEKNLNVKVGETTKDKLFTLVEVECLGACANAPMMQINEDYYEDLTPKIATDILDTLRKGGKPKTGPQQSRKFAMPAAGKTTLLESPYGPGDYVRPDL